MQKIKISFILICSLSLINKMTFAQQAKLTTYRGEKFVLDYPSLWQTSNENDILNFFPKENYGSVTISIYQGIDFSIDKTKEFILEMNEVKDNPENVKMTKKKDIVEFYYEHIDKNIKWVTKAVRKNNDFYLLTINCELKKWDTDKILFLRTLNSFQLI